MATNIGTLMATIGADTRPLKKGLRDAERQTKRSTDKMATNWSKYAKSIAKTGAVMLAASTAYNIGKDLIATGIAAERMAKGLDAAMGSAMKGAEAQQFLREQSERLGLVFEDQVRGFQKIAAAAQGTILQGQAIRDVYLGITEASTALQLTSYETEGALLAVSQMISKGTVSAEELRGQLGERLPGAFQIAAKAMGVTTRELGKMMEKGELLAVDFLPKFAKALSARHAGSIASASETAQAEINRLNNAVFDMKKAFTDIGVLDAYTRVVKDMTEVVEDLGYQINLVTGFWSDLLSEKTPEPLVKTFKITDRPKSKKELERDDDLLRQVQEKNESLLNLEKQFNEQYAKVVYSRYDIERKRAEETATIYTKAGYDKIKTAEILREKLKTIDEMEIEDKRYQLEQEQEIADEKMTIIVAAMDKRQELMELDKEFNQEYAEMGKSRFDIERMQVEELMNKYQGLSDRKIELAQLTSDKMKAISKAESQQRISDVYSTVSALTDGFKMISEMGGKHSKEAFAMYKAFKIAETIISTYSGAMKAYESLASIPYIGPVLGAAAAAAVVGFGMAQVAMIKNAQPPSYDLGGISNAHGIYQTGNIEEAHIPLPSGGKIPVSFDRKPGVEASGENNDTPNEITINYNINAVDAYSFTELTRRNPDAISGPLINEIKKGNNALRQAINVA